MSIQDLDLLHRETPELFAPRIVEEVAGEEWSVIPIGDPEWLGSVSQDLESSARVPEEIEDLQRDWQVLEAMAASIPVDEPIQLHLPQVILPGLSGAFAGALQPAPPPTHPISPDCLATYLPFHYFHPDWWGIYILFDGLIWMRNELFRLSKGTLDPSRALQVARLRLYHHEAFHHGTECFATRLELTHRRPFYIRPFEDLYQSTRGTDDSLEEALAEGAMLGSIRKKVAKDPDREVVFGSLLAQVRSGPPGYRRGAGLWKAPAFRKSRCLFAEQNQQACLPGLPRKNPSVWASAPHMFDGIANIRSRTNYLLLHTSPLLSRINFRPCLTPTKLIRKLNGMVGLEQIRQKGSHRICRTPDGRETVIPMHARDLGKGLLRKILKDLGLSMGVEAFLRA